MTVRLSEIISRSFRKEASDEEEAELRRWIDNSQENQRSFDLMTSDYFIFMCLSNSQDCHPGEAWKEVETLLDKSDRDRLEVRQRRKKIVGTTVKIFIASVLALTLVYSVWQYIFAGRGF